MTRPSGCPDGTVRRSSDVRTPGERKKAQPLRGPSPAIGRSALVRFLVIYCGAMAVYFGLTLSIEFQNPADAQGRPIVAALIAANRAAHRYVLTPYQELLTSAAGAIVDALGYDVSVTGREIRSASFAVSVASGCDALELTLLWWAAVIAFPAPWPHKLRGWLAGTVAIAVLNFFRILSLWIVGVHWKGAFEWVHFIVWPFVLTTATLMIFLLWMGSVLRKLPQTAPG